MRKKLSECRISGILTRDFLCRHDLQAKFTLCLLAVGAPEDDIDTMISALINR